MITDLVFKLLAFIVLTPVVALLWQILLALGGSSVLSDIDIARFFFGPFGWCCAIMMGAMWGGIVALEQVSLLYILAARQAGKAMDATSAIRYAMTHVVGVLSIAARLVGWSLLVIAPFLAVAAGVYFWLLGEYDINYYLNERPSEFKIAVVLGLVLVAMPIVILLRLFSGWFLALPLAAFDLLPSRESLQTSTQLLSGKRIAILAWLVGWLVVVLLCNLLLTALVGSIGQILMPQTAGSLIMVTTRVGLMLLLLAASSLILNVIASIVFAAILFHCYQQYNPAAEESITSRLSDADALTDDRRPLVTRFRLLAAAVIGTLAASIAGYWLLSSLSLEDKAQIMAHRGASVQAPENTIAAFQQAIEIGAEWIEIDVQETADGEVVVMHDSDFMKLSNNPLKIWDATMDDLKQLDIGSWKDPRFSDQRVPTLKEVLQLCRDRAGVNIELKYYGHDQQLEQRVVDIVEQEGMSDQVMVMSLKPEAVKKVKTIQPNLKCGVLLSVHVGKLEDIEADFLAVNSRFATASFVQRAHRADKQVFVWTVNDVTTMSRMLNRQVDGILTDRPDLALQVLKQRAEMSNAERLLVELAIFFDPPRADSEQ